MKLVKLLLVLNLLNACQLEATSSAILGKIASHSLFIAVSGYTGWKLRGYHEERIREMEQKTIERIVKLETRIDLAQKKCGIDTSKKETSGLLTSQEGSFENKIRATEQKSSNNVMYFFP
ncbi:MAG: hypothetical protein LVQ75_04515 [Candidatus Babeliales bacterium]|jgi:hypothetical protein